MQTNEWVTQSPEALFDQIKGLSDEEKMERITETLVRIRSINGTAGEVHMAEYLEAFIRAFPYFRSNPSHVWTQELPNDSLKRRNVYALVRKAASSQTILYHSHMDTVGIEDYRDIKAIASSPEELKEHFSKYSDNPEVRSHARSDQWMFGRGALDMKSGIAVHIVNLLHFCCHLEELEGNILLMLNPVEENEHTGVIQSIHELKRVQEDLGLSIQLAVNSDFVTELYPGDPHYYIYTGAVGKLLPCFSISGREVHVGETVKGVDPTLVSSEINIRINNNMELSEKMEGEHMLPPTCLQQRDIKDFYNVQTPPYSRLYFNYFIYEASPDEVMRKLVEQAEDACRSAKSHMEKQYRTFIKQGDYPDTEALHWDISVYTFEAYVNYLESHGIDVKAVTDRMTDPDGMDKREMAFHVVETLQALDPDKKPKVIVFFAPPYCPHNYLRNHVEEEREILHILDTVIQKNKLEDKVAVKKFFPFLSDSSYLSLHDSNEEVKSLINNFPEYEKIYPVPIQEIRKLNIPSITMGVFGKDAHKYTERVYKPYSFRILPHLIREVTVQVLNK
ncbi:M20/M25/M40 family metallo-hydrolase [Bacillus sp. SB49]|nr:M20/M25/M40 family metallo-hydrolase [Bacillus sp. SB49]